MTHKPLSREELMHALANSLASAQIAMRRIDGLPESRELLDRLIDKLHEERGAEKRD